MRKDVPPQKISDLRVFPSSLSPVSSASAPRDIYQISKDGSYVWTAKGCVLEVFTAPQLRRISYWGFPALAKNPEVYISAVSELPSWGGMGGASSAPYLLVSLSQVNLLCLYDICNSKVVKCIQIPVQLSCLEVISSRGGACQQTLALWPDLRLMFGLVALGTIEGNILLLDLCLDEPQQMASETAPAQVLLLEPQQGSVAANREQALEHNEHLCISLSEQSKRRGSFKYKGPKNKSLAIINADDACVTSMMYVPHATLLVVGYKFGSFQLWNLQNLSIEYASSLSNDFSSVVRFSFQEPENDPRNYCYLWVVCGQDSPVIESESASTTAYLYSLSFDRKDWQDGFGFQYQCFNHCMQRFEHLLTVDPFNQSDIEETGGSRLVTFSMIRDHQATTNRPLDMEDPPADEWSNQDLSLCLIVWEAWEPPESPGYFMAVFDINQWYQAQMPSNTRRPGMDSYFGVFSLMEVVENMSQDFVIQDMHVSLSSLLRFRKMYAVDEVYHPSAFGFKATCLTDGGLLEISYLGTQRQLLLDLQNCGLEVLKEPTELFIHCRQAGLLSHSDSISLNQKREALLTMALENNLLSYLKECILQAPTVDYHPSGFSLRFILEWAWKRVTQIKAHVDKLCVPLFNCSGQLLDPTSLSLLYNYASQLESLTNLYQIMQFQAPQATTQTGIEELSVREEVVQLLCVYLQVTLWLHQYCCLLPEHTEGDAYGENEVAYPASILASDYAQRRLYLQRLHSTVGPTDLLLIDGFISKLGDLLPLHWQRGSNGPESGQRLYPPPSLFAFLNVYLVRDVPLIEKHCLTLYLLLDLADFLSHKQSHLEERIMQFPAAFKMPPSLVKIVQGFWMLDRKDYAKATAFLTDPVVHSHDLEQWQHTRVLKSLLFQGQERLGLSYVTIRKPPLDSPDNIKLHLSLLLSNGLIYEAFNFQKQRADDDLLNHFFLGCQQTSNMCALLELPLNANEEQSLVSFLSESPEPKSKEMLAVYFLQRHRPLQALEYTDRHSRRTSGEYSSMCSSLVNQFIKILPPAQVRLVKELSKPFSQTAYPSGRRLPSDIVPVPLSSLVTRAVDPEEHSSHATHLQSVMLSLTSTWNKKTLEPQTPLRSRLQASDMWTLDSMPFVGTPAAVRMSRRSESELVYATPVGKRSSSSVTDVTESPKFPNKRSRGMDIVSPVRQINSDRRENRAFASEVMLLLQTPPVKRRPPEPKVSALSSRTPQMTATPPSILKGSQWSSRQPAYSNPQVPIVYPRPHSSEKTTDDVSETDMELGENDSINISEDEPEDQKLIHFDTRSSPTRSTPPTARVPRRLSKSPTLNIDFSSPILHESDELIVEDEDISFNISMHNRKARRLKLGRSYIDPPPTVERRNRGTENSISGRSFSRSDTTQNVPPSTIHELEDSSIVILNSGSNPVAATSDNVQKPSIESHSDDSMSAVEESCQESRGSLGTGNLLTKSAPSPSIVFLEKVDVSATSRNSNIYSKSSDMPQSQSGFEVIEVVSSPDEDRSWNTFKLSSPDVSFEQVSERKLDTLTTGSDGQGDRSPKPPSVGSRLELSSDEELDEKNIPSAFRSDNVRKSYPVSESNVIDLCESVQEEESCRVGRWVDGQDASRFTIDRREPIANVGMREGTIQIGSEESSSGLRLSEKTSTFKDVSQSMSNLEVTGPFECEQPLSESDLNREDNDASEVESRVTDTMAVLEETGPFQPSHQTSCNVESDKSDVWETPSADYHRDSYSVQPIITTFKREILETVAVSESKETPVQQSRAIKAKSGRRKTTVLSTPSQVLPPLPELSPPPSERSPNSSVFTTPEKTSPLSSLWNSRLRRRPDSRTSSDSSVQYVKGTATNKAPLERASSSPSFQLSTPVPVTNAHRKVTRSTKKEPVESQHQNRNVVLVTPTIPEESEDLLREEYSTPKAALPFVFSPPSTRSRTRRKKSDTPDTGTQPSQQQGIGLLSSNSRPTTRSRKSVASSSTDSTAPLWPADYVKLISPFVGKEAKPRRSSTTSRASTSTLHSMILRAAGPRKPRKVVQLK